MDIGGGGRVSSGFSFLLPLCLLCFGLLTFLNPMSSAFSRKAWRDMLRPYLRMRPAFFLSPVTRLFFVFLFLLSSESSSPPSESTQRLKQRKDNLVCTRTSFESLCHRSVGASTRRFRASCCFVAFVVILELNNIGGLCSKRRKGEWREKQDKSKSIKRRYKVVEGLEVCHAFGKGGGVDHQGAFASA